MPPTTAFKYRKKRLRFQVVFFNLNFLRRSFPIIIKAYFHKAVCNPFRYLGDHRYPPLPMWPGYWIENIPKLSPEVVIMSPNFSNQDPISASVSNLFRRYRSARDSIFFNFWKIFGKLVKSVLFA